MKCLEQYFMFEKYKSMGEPEGWALITECAKHGLYLIGELLPTLWW